MNKRDYTQGWQWVGFKQGPAQTHSCYGWVWQWISWCEAGLGFFVPTGLGGGVFNLQFWDEEAYEDKDSEDEESRDEEDDDDDDSPPPSPL